MHGKSRSNGKNFFQTHGRIRSNGKNFFRTHGKSRSNGKNFFECLARAVRTARKFFERTARAVPTADKHLPNGYPLGTFLRERSHLLSSIIVRALVKNSSKGMSSCLRHLSWYLDSIWLFCGFVYASNFSNFGLSFNWSASISQVAVFVAGPQQEKPRLLTLSLN